MQVALSGSYPITGWTRACSVFSDLNACSGTLNSNVGGWGGWIKINDILPNNAYIDPSTSPAQFHQWVWGGNPDGDPTEAVTGWGTFNCYEGGDSGASVCSNSNYKVVTTFSLVSPPIVTDTAVAVNNLSNSSDYCNNGAEAYALHLNWTYIDASNNAESEYQIEVENAAAYQANGNSFDPFGSNKAEISYDTGSTTFANTSNSYTAVVSLSPNQNAPLSFSTKYYWQVKVYDNLTPANNSGWVSGGFFTTDTHAWPAPSFTVTPANPLLKTPITFTDTSICCAGTGLCTSTWSIDNSFGTTPFIHNYAPGFSSCGQQNVTLQVCDTGTTECCLLTNPLTIQCGHTGGGSEGGCVDPNNPNCTVTPRQ